MKRYLVPVMLLLGAVPAFAQSTVVACTPAEPRSGRAGRCARRRASATR